MTPIGTSKCSVWPYTMYPFLDLTKKKSETYRTCYLHFRVLYFLVIIHFLCIRRQGLFVFLSSSVGCHYNKNHEGSLISINLRDCIETWWNVCSYFPNILIMFIEFRRGCRVRARWAATVDSAADRQIVNADRNDIVFVMFHKKPHSTKHFLHRVSKFFFSNGIDDWVTKWADKEKAVW